MRQMQWARALYPSLAGQVYLDVAAVGLVSTRVEAAMIEINQAHGALGTAAVAAWTGNLARGRQAVAELIGGSADRVAFTQNTSTGVALVANGIDWADGDNVVVPAAEFPSVFYPWTQLRRHGVEVREIPMVDGHADLDLVPELIDARTRVLAIATVQYTSGHRYDLGRLASIKRDALLVVDGTQSVGALTIDVDGIDVLAVSAHKWMLGPLGIGFAHFSEQAMERLHPSVVGWLSVEQPFEFAHEPRLAADGRRFESGVENAVGIAGLSAAIGIVLELGPAAVEAWVLERTAELAELLGATVRGSGILIAAGDAALHERLLAAGVRCSLRGGGVRFSPHYYTNSADLELVAEVVRR
jgi:selenocysteine lyase/cysteine desulfurase